MLRRCLVALLLSGCALAVPTAAEAAPVVRLVPELDTSYPVQVPAADSGQELALSFTVSSSEPLEDAQLYASGEGLAISAPVQELGTLAGAREVTVGLAGQTSGPHTLFVAITAPGMAQPVQISFPNVVTTGSPLVPGTGRRYRQTYAWQRPGTGEVAALSIASATQAFVGLPAHGVPTCEPVVAGCLPYSSTYPGYLQVGGGIFADSHDRCGLYTDGLVPAEPGEPFGRHDFATDTYVPDGNYELEGTFRYRSAGDTAGLTYQKVTFRPDGTYRLAYAVRGGRVKRLSGTFHLGRRGAVTFRVGTRVRQVGTVLIPTRRGCLPQQRRLGLWLVLSGKRGAHPDGNLLAPVG